MRAALAALALILSGCVVPTKTTVGPVPQMVDAAEALPTPRAAAQTFLEVVARMEPVVEEICRDRTQGVKCDFRIVVNDRPGEPANAFQTVDERGRPIVGFTLALIASARNADELAFVMGHEAAHHILGHIPKRQDQELSGALIAGVLAQVSGLSSDEVHAAQSRGAAIAGRSFSKDFELQADALGAEVALRAGFDPVHGAAFFDRLPDPGDKFLGSHPPNARRKAVVVAVVRRLAAQ